MLGSVLFPTPSHHSQPHGLRRNTYSITPSGITPPRRNSISLSTTPAAQTSKIQLKLTTIPSDSSTHTKSTTSNSNSSISSSNTSSKTDSMYKRSTSPRRHQYGHPARSSTGTFADPYYDYSSYPRPSSPRSSGERIAGNSRPSSYYTPSSTTSSRTTVPSSYTTTSSSGRPRRNTGEAMQRPTASATSILPIRTPYTPLGHSERPGSPLAHSWDKRDKRASAGDTYITQGPARDSRTQHKKIYSVDDNSKSTQLVAETEPARHRDTADRGYGNGSGSGSGTTSGGRTYHNSSKPPSRLTDLGDDGYSYTDPASMYRDTEPAWRRPRAGSLERTSRPSSLIMDSRAPRSSARELGPPPSVRGFDKINNNISRSSHGRSPSIERGHGRSSSIDRPRDIPKYDQYADAAPSRTSSTRHHAPAAAIHQEPRRDTYHDTYDRRDIENRRHATADHLPDPQVASRGFGIAPGTNPALAHDHHALDRQPIWSPHEAAPPRPDEYGSQYHSSHRADARMPEPPRASRDREVAPPSSYDGYEKRPREREGGSGFGSAVAGAATGVAATLGAAGYMKSRDKDREERNSSEERDRERERRRAYDERDSRDKVDDRRDRRADEREEKRERRPEERREAPPVAAAYPPPPPEAERKPRERRYEDDERERSSRKAGSSEDSADERPRHYVDREAERRDAERRSQAPPPSKDSALDPDEEYRRRVQQEAERSSRSTRDRDDDSDRERRRRRDGPDSSRGVDERSHASPPTAGREPSSSRYDDRSSSVYDANMVQEPEVVDKLQADLPNPNKAVTIVSPPKEPQPQVKGILRRPTEKFPEEPEPIREGVAPHKDALKGKDIPIGARWTRIDRRLVNPQALEEAKERFEERMDCVIVLRVLTKSEIQKLADRTKKIRERRGMLERLSVPQKKLTNSETEDDTDDRDRDYNQDDRDKRSSHRDDEARDRERRSHRDERDDEDRDRRSHRDDRDDEERDRRERRRREYDEESDYADLGREKERPKELEPAR